VQIGEPDPRILEIIEMVNFQSRRIYL